jgi:flavin reductase (DIM6/NTAB) family NADH-FMN oxidoreductase RutF
VRPSSGSEEASLVKGLKEVLHIADTYLDKETEMDRAAFQKVSYGMYVVSSREKNLFNGQIANTVFQVSSEPPTIAISINKQNYTHEFIRTSLKFTASIISQSAPMTFIGLFGFKSGRDFNKFENTKFKIGTTGVPIVLDYAIAYIEAEVINAIDCGTHTIFIGKVIDSGVINSEEPMTYSYYHEVKRGKSPKTAPTYIMEEPRSRTEK